MDIADVAVITSAVIVAIFSIVATLHLAARHDTNVAKLIPRSEPRHGRDRMVITREEQRRILNDRANNATPMPDVQDVIHTTTWMDERR